MFILIVNAPELADYCRSAGSTDKEAMKTVQIDNVEPAIFASLLKYVYGGTIPIHVFTKHAKDIINVADRFGVSALKVAAKGTTLP